MNIKLDKVALVFAVMALVVAMLVGIGVLMGSGGQVAKPATRALSSQGSQYLGNVVIDGNLRSSVGAVTITDQVMVDNPVDATALIVQGYTTQTNPLLVLEQSDGTDRFVVSGAGAVTVTGAARLTSTLRVDGASDLRGDVSDGGGDFTIADNVDITGTLHVTGATDFEAAALFESSGDFRTQISNGGANHSGQLYVADDAEITGTLLVDGASDLRGNLSDGGGSLTLADNAIITGTLDVRGDVSRTGADLRLADNVNITGTLTLENVAFSGPVKFGSAASVVSGTLIAHGLATTPTAVVLTPFYNGVFTNTVYVRASNATSFTVALGYTQGVATVTRVYWMAGR